VRLKDPVFCLVSRRRPDPPPLSVAASVEMDTGASLAASVLDAGDAALGLGDHSSLLGSSDGMLAPHGHAGMPVSHSFALRQPLMSAHAVVPHGGGAMVGDEVDTGLAAAPVLMSQSDYDGSHLDKKYVCDQCGFRTHRQYCLTTHMRTHTGEKPYKCPECDKAYSESRTLKVHIATTHTGERPHKCLHCDATFADPKILKRHMRTHSEDKPYVCGFCGRGFRQSYQRVVHMRRHTGERPYKCDMCDESFAQSSSYTVHLRKHTGERPYVCDVCQATFIDNSRLTSHKARHLIDKPFKCDQCEEAFVRRPALVAHLRKHSGEKPFKADRKALASHPGGHDDLEYGGEQAVEPVVGLLGQDELGRM
jgi:uncharacterized Zn-finger protein